MNAMSALPFKEKRHGTQNIARRFEHDRRRFAGIGITN
jgi:hypothetical protein